MKHFIRLCASISLLALSACEDAPPSAYQIRTPDSMIMPVTDIVTIELADKTALEKLNDTLAKNPPVRATLNCPIEKKTCVKAKLALTKNKIPFETAEGGNHVSLMYERVAAKDCNQRYVDNSQNQRNLNYESLGCSLYGNLVQMTTDKRQFTNPALLDYVDGEKAASVYDSYLNPPAASAGSPSSGNTGAQSLIPSSSGGQ